MSKELRILLIVFGSLIGVCVIAFGALLFMLPRLMHNMVAASDNPAAMQRTASKIATFVVPAGYRIRSAMDLTVTQTATLAPIERGKAFQIQLQGMSIPASDSSQDQGASLGLKMTAGILHCELQPDREASYIVRGQVIKLHVMACNPKGGRGLKVEYGTFPGNAATARITATGFGGDFDDGALRALLRSVR